MSSAKASSWPLLRPKLLEAGSCGSPQPLQQPHTSRTAGQRCPPRQLFFFVSGALVGISCRRPQLPVRKTKAREKVKSCTEKVKRHTQGICSARKEHRSGWRLQVAGSNPKGQAGVGRQPAICRGCRCARKREPRWQPKTGEVRGYSDSSGRARSLCEQAPAYYTSMRHSANRHETVEALHWDQGSLRSQAAKRATH